MRHRTLAFGAAFISALTSFSAPAAAQELGGVQLNGFGSWAYGRTNGNPFATGREQGNYNNLEFGLAVSAAPAERARVSVQIFSHAGEFRIDYALAEWRVSDALRLRFGRIKQPHGLYTEVFDVGTIRPLATLPQSIYGSSGLVSEGVDGAGIAGGRSLGSWRVEYDVYGGNMAVETSTPFAAAPDSPDPEETEHAQDVTNLVGARVNVRLPISGWLVGASGYSGRNVAAADARHSTVGAHTEFRRGAALVRSEVARHELGTERSVNAAFLETAYRLTEHWQLAGRADHSRTRVSGTEAEMAAAMPDLGKHREFAAGVNYWFTPELVLRVSGHRVYGNRFATPDADALRTALSAARAAGTTGVNGRTTLFSVGVQASF